MKILRTGCTRIVIVTKRFAFKLPNFLDGWSMFLRGLLANLEEAGWSKMLWKNENSMGLCPVVFSLKGGFLIVMRKARILTWEEFCEFDYETFTRTKAPIPVEQKADSFGWLDGEIVAVDYGN